MQFRRDAPFAIIGAIIIAVATMTALSNRMFQTQMATVEAAQYDLMRAIVDFNLRGAEDRALARAEMVADMPAVRTALAAQDRPRLLAETAEMYRIQAEKYGVDQAQFHLPPATSFLRLNAPEKGQGEDLSSFRPLVVAVNQDHVARKGLSIGRSGPGLFGVSPILDLAGKPIGSFEIGMDFGPVLDRLKAAYGLELTLFIKERPLREVATGLSPESFDEHGQVGEYIKYRSTQWELMRRLVTSTDLAAVDGDPVQFSRDALGVPYGLVLVSLRNAAGDPIGIVAAAKDFTATRAAAGRALIKQGTMGIFAIVLLAGIVLVVIRGFLLRPLGMLGQRYAALAEGDREGKVEDRGALCQELQSLAAAHETLRTSEGGKAVEDES